MEEFKKRLSFGDANMLSLASQPQSPLPHDVQHGAENPNHSTAQTVSVDIETFLNNL